jgi:hypothetical protein
MRLIQANDNEWWALSQIHRNAGGGRGGVEGREDSMYGSRCRRALVLGQLATWHPTVRKEGPKGGEQKENKTEHAK